MGCSNSHCSSKREEEDIQNHQFAVVLVVSIFWNDESFHLRVACESRLGKRRKDGAVMRELASLQCGPGSIPVRCHMWVEFVVGSRFAPRVFSEFYRFTFSSLHKNQR